MQRFKNNWQLTMSSASLLVLAISETLLVCDLSSEFFGFDISFYDDYHFELESLAILSVGISLIIMGTLFYRLLRENTSFRTTINLASGQFLNVMYRKFDDWQLSASESEVALLLIKGLSIQEIAKVRATMPGTIKSQSNAIYSKALVKGRNELAAYFVEDLLCGQNLTTTSA